jgi:hypothetical protein
MKLLDMRNSRLAIHGCWGSRGEDRSQAEPFWGGTRQSNNTFLLRNAIGLSVNIASPNRHICKVIFELGEDVGLKAGSQINSN